MVKKIGHRRCTEDIHSCENEGNAKKRIVQFHSVQSGWRDWKLIFLILQMWVGTRTAQSKVTDHIF